MKTRHVLMLSTAVALTAIGASTAPSHAEQTVLTTRTPSFLSPLPSRLVFTPTDSKFCRNLPGLLCPPALIYGGAGGPALHHRASPQAGPAERAGQLRAARRSATRWLRTGG